MINYLKIKVQFQEVYKLNNLQNQNILLIHLNKIFKKTNLLFFKIIIQPRINIYQLLDINKSLRIIKLKKCKQFKKNKIHQKLLKHNNNNQKLMKTYCLTIQMPMMNQFLLNLKIFSINDY